MASTVALVSSQEPNNGGSRWPNMLRLQGIFDYDPNRNPMAGANLVQARACQSERPVGSSHQCTAAVETAYGANRAQSSAAHDYPLPQIGYCSSDAWVGDSAPDENALSATPNAAGGVGWAFKGQRIIQATLATLAQQFGLGSLPGTRLLFGGCSAGARGALFTLDYVQSMVPSGVQARLCGSAAQHTPAAPLLTYLRALPPTSTWRSASQTPPLVSRQPQPRVRAGARLPGQSVVGRRGSPGEEYRAS